MTIGSGPDLKRRSLLAGLGAVAAGLKLTPRTLFAAEEKKLNFFNWDTYTGKTTLEDFQKATGIEVTLEIYNDSEVLFNKLKDGNPGYDVIVPADSYVDRMARAGMLVELNRAKLPNIINMDPSFMNAAFDRGRRHSLTYMWGTIGIGYRKSAVKGTPDSWKWVFDSDRYSGRIAWLDEAQTMIQAALKYLGHPANTINPEHIRAAGALLVKQRPHVKVITPDDGQDLLLAGEVDLAVEYNGDVLQVMEKDDDLDFIVPKEGTMVWQDCLAIPVGAPHPDNAHAFINFLLDAEVAADTARSIRYATPNAAAREFLSQDYLENPVIFPPGEVLEKSEVAWYRGEGVLRLYDELWSQVLAA